MLKEMGSGNGAYSEHNGEQDRKTVSFVLLVILLTENRISSTSAIKAQFGGLLPLGSSLSLGHGHLKAVQCGREGCIARRAVLQRRNL